MPNKVLLTEHIFCYMSAIKMERHKDAYPSNEMIGMFNNACFLFQTMYF